MSHNSIIAASDKIKSDLEWRGPNGGELKHVVLSRDAAQAILDSITAPPAAGMREAISADELKTIEWVRGDENYKPCAIPGDTGRALIRIIDRLSASPDQTAAGAVRAKITVRDLACLIEANSSLIYPACRSLAEILINRLTTTPPSLDPVTVEACAKWHDGERQGGHCGESSSEIIMWQRRNAWHEASAAAIRALTEKKIKENPSKQKEPS